MLKDQFKQQQTQLFGQTIPWLNHYRKDALDFFHPHGLPNRQMEDWKYTDLAPILQHDFQFCFDEATLSQDAILPFMLDKDYHLMVFVNGLYNARLSTLSNINQGVRVTTLALAIEQGDKAIEEALKRAAGFNAASITAINAAMMSDGCVIQCEENAILEKPLHLLFMATRPEMMQHLHTIVLLEKYAKATLIEHYVGLTDASTFTTAVNTVSLQEGACLHHYKLQQEGPKSYHLGRTEVMQSTHSQYHSFNLDLGGKLARNDIKSTLDASGASCNLSGLYLATNRQHIDNHTEILHKKPSSQSNEYYKGIIDDSARAVFNGKVKVFVDAQHTKAQQNNKNLLLSDKAEIDTKPQLEIDADDVQCSHGATVGELDQTALFYLQSRGIDLLSAKAALTYGFARDVINTIPLPALQQKVDELFVKKLPNGCQIQELGLV